MHFLLELSQPMCVFQGLGCQVKSIRFLNCKATIFPSYYVFVDDALHLCKYALPTSFNTT